MLDNPARWCKLDRRICYDFKRGLIRAALETSRCVRGNIFTPAREFWAKRDADGNWEVNIGRKIISTNDEAAARLIYNGLVAFDKTYSIS